MAIPSTGPFSLFDIQDEFGGTEPISINEYYRNSPTGYVKTYTATSTIPTSGTISFSQFRGTAGIIRYTIASDITDANAQTLFNSLDGGGIDYWGGNYEKELVINSGVNVKSSTRSISALTLPGSMGGRLTVINRGIISGAGGQTTDTVPFSSKDGGTALYTGTNVRINNIGGTIRGGGGAGSDGRNGGDGGNGGTGQKITGYNNSWAYYDLRYQKNNDYVIVLWLYFYGYFYPQGITTIKYKGKTIYSGGSIFGGLVGSPYRPPGSNFRYFPVNPVQGCTNIYGAVAYFTCIYPVYVEQLTSVPVYTSVSGCPGFAGASGGYGGRGEGSDGASTTGTAGNPRTAINDTCVEGGAGGYGGRGGDGVTGGAYGQFGSNALKPDNGTGGAEKGGSGLIGDNTTSTTGLTGGKNPTFKLLPEGKAGYYIQRANTAIVITWVDNTGAAVAANGTRQGIIN